MEYIIHKIPSSVVKKSIDKKIERYKKHKLSELDFSEEIDEWINHELDYYSTVYVAETINEVIKITKKFFLVYSNCDPLTKGTGGFASYKDAVKFFMNGGR